MFIGSVRPVNIYLPFNVCVMLSIDHLRFLINRKNQVQIFRSDNNVYSTCPDSYKGQPCLQTIPRY